MENRKFALSALATTASTALLLLSLGAGAATAQPASGQHPAAPGVDNSSNPYVPAGALWTQSYFGSTGGVELHADVLRPKNLAADAKTPVILSVGPYFSHAGQTGSEGRSQTGPSSRFTDLIDGAKLMDRGYTVVLVDLRGFGGSTGCLDWQGLGEQADVAASVNWAASQPWSTGKVGLYGKSYDASTGLMGLGSGASGLKAVVAQEPVYDAYRYLYSNGVARPNHSGTPAAYDGIAQIAPVGGANGDDAHYAKNAGYEKSHPECVRNNDTLTQNPDHSAAFWQDRNLITKAAGSTVPLFLTQGMIEPNTKPEGVDELLSVLKGPVRGWFGQWDHVRGNDTDAEGNLAMGRAGWFDEVMRFYDRNLKGITPSVTDPAFAIEGSDGIWRQQGSWPGQSTAASAKIGSGSYSATTKNAFSAQSEQPAPQTDMETMRRTPLSSPAAAGSSGVWTRSQPVAQRTRITGTPMVHLQSSSTKGNAVAALYDVAADGSAVQIDLNISVLAGNGRTDFALKSTDWTLEKGHSLAVRISSDDARNWSGPANQGSIKVTGGSIDLLLQDPASDLATQGDRSGYLDEYLQNARANVPQIAPSFELKLNS
ncbi:CocE/NonD family hydrolase [Arthrobacter russicus]|uniref:CocE/NonD family hydrolase n=1 Tax=Arthrobacter russicus TaxID=172040 RepID=A0ABU1JGW4_9MICC|nr:CocE/NonD family hydrolase [Arthrobacter russicus]MDR6271111.1 putative CocE/NonD family hydrolase [Arthrobacter russicus]